MSATASSTHARLVRVCARHGRDLTELDDAPDELGQDQPAVVQGEERVHLRTPRADGPRPRCRSPGGQPRVHPAREPQGPALARRLWIWLAAK